MKRKKSIVVISIIILSSLFHIFNVNFYTNNATAYSSYSQRTDPSNPWIMTVDTIYATDSWVSHLSETYYNKVYLIANRYYIFYLSGGPANEDHDTTIIYSSGGTALFSGSLYDIFSYYRTIILIKPPTTGYYNLTIDSSSGSSTSLTGMAFLEVPEIFLNVKSETTRWSFQANSINAAIIDLEAGEEYITGSNNTPLICLGSCDVYYLPLSSVSGIEYLDISHTKLNYNSSINTVSSSGKYLFYSRNGYDIGIMENPTSTPENGTPDDIPPPNYLPQILLLLAFVSIPTVLVVVIVVIVKKKRTKKRTTLQKPQLETKPKLKIEETSAIEEKSKNRLFGMIKVEKKINLANANKYVKIPKDEIKGLIYDLAGEGKIEGEFQGEDFVITSDVADFLNALDDGFKQWETSKDKIL